MGRAGERGAAGGSGKAGSDESAAFDGNGGGSRAKPWQGWAAASSTRTMNEASTAGTVQFSARYRSVPSHRRTDGAGRREIGRTYRSVPVVFPHSSFLPDSCRPKKASPSVNNRDIPSVPEIRMSCTADRTLTQPYSIPLSVWNGFPLRNMASIPEKTGQRHVMYPGTLLKGFPPDSADRYAAVPVPAHRRCRQSSAPTHACSCN